MSNMPIRAVPVFGMSQANPIMTLYSNDQEFDGPIRATPVKFNATHTDNENNTTFKLVDFKKTISSFEGTNIVEMQSEVKESSSNLYDDYY